jgi:hypothetical protein
MIALKLLGLWGWLKEAAVALLGLVRRYPLQAALIASLCLSGWLWRGKQEALGERDLARVQFADCQRAGIKAREAQIALNKETKAKYEAAAKEADHEHEKALALANDRTERWIANHRVRQAGGSGADRSGAAAENQAAGVHQEMPADAVLVGAADVRICTARSQDALSAYEFGQALIKAGVAE